MLVTLYLFGASAYIELKTIGYQELEDAVLLGYPELVSMLPDFSAHCLCVSYKETEQAQARYSVSIAPHSRVEVFPELDEQWSEVSICLVITVSVYKAGKEMVAKKSDLLFSTNFYSTVAIASFVQRCNKILQAHVKWRTMETDCCDENGVMFIAEHLMFPQQNHKEIFVLQRQSHYANASIMQLLTKVAFPEAVMDRIKEHGTKRKFGDNAKYLDAFEGALPIETPLQATVKSAHAELNAAHWKARVNACVDNLELLNRHVAPASYHSVSARRLVIDEVVKQVVSYTGDSFSVKELQNSAKYTDERFLGWGHVDYTISDYVLLNALGDENEDETTRGPAQSLCAADRSVRTPADEEYLHTGDEEEADEGAVVLEVTEEGKVMLDDGGLAQGGSQSHDRLEACPEVERVAIVLCSGHRWRHFVLHRGTGGANTKPVLTYLGEASMRVLRNTVASADMPRGKSTTRSYCRPSDDYKVDRGEVENVMISLLCSLRCRLHSAETTTTAMRGSSSDAVEV